MPNYVKNIVTISDPKVMEQMLVIKRDGEYDDSKLPQFDFNKVIPMPEELADNRLTTYPLTDEATELAKRNKEKYGAEDWYRWRIDNWDTKWNACSTEVIDDTTVEFDTAWSTPTNVIRKLSEKFDVRVRVKYADEDIGSNCGEYEYYKGNLTYKRKFKTSEEVFEFACDVWGLDPEEERRFREEWEDE